MIGLGVTIVAVVVLVGIALVTMRDGDPTSASGRNAAPEDMEWTGADVEPATVSEAVGDAGETNLHRTLTPAESEAFAQTAVTVSQRLFPDGEADEVVLVRDHASGDALAAGSLIGLFDTTFLLTDSDQLSPITAEEIDRLGTPRVHILGGQAAIAPEIEEELLAAGHNVHRHAGPTQPDTAVDIARSHFADAQTAVLLRTTDPTQGPIEAVSSALAATTMAAAQELPVLLTAGDALSDSTERFLENASIRQIIVIGNDDEISADVTLRLRELGIDWTRWGGDDRFANAVEIARNRGFDSLRGADAVALVDGDHESVWPAGLLGSVLAAQQNGPVLLTQGDELPTPTAAYLASGAGEAELICTPGVTEAACSTARDLLAGNAAAPQAEEPVIQDGVSTEALAERAPALGAEEDNAIWLALGLVLLLLSLLGLGTDVSLTRRRRRDLLHRAGASSEPTAGGSAVPGIDGDEYGAEAERRKSPAAEDETISGPADLVAPAVLHEQRLVQSTELQTRALQRRLRLQVRLTVAVCISLPVALVAVRQTIDGTYLRTLTASAPGVVALVVVTGLIGLGTVWLLNLELTTAPAWPWRRHRYARERRTETELLHVLRAAAQCAIPGVSLKAAVKQATNTHPSQTAELLRARLDGAGASPAEAKGAGPVLVADCARALLDAHANGEDPLPAVTAAAASLATYRYRCMSYRLANVVRDALLPIAACVLPTTVLLLAIG